MSAFTNKAIGGFLVGEAILSILFSEDKSNLSQSGRLIRIGIGYYIWKQGATT
jgi:hypothetical protein